MTLTPEDVEALATRTADVLTERKRAHWVDPQLHAEHHSWTAVQIQAELDRTEFWRGVRQKILVSAAIWSLPILLGAVMLASWEWFIDRIREALGS